MMASFETLLIAGFAAVQVFFVVILWQIWSKAGYSGALALLHVVPIVNVVALCYLAFSDWPVRKRLRQPAGDAP